MSIFEAVVLGIVQGLTEFLPVSSTAHLILVPMLCGWERHALAFDMALHLGTLVAVAGYFRSDLLDVARGGLRTLRKPDLRGDPGQRLAWMLVIGTIPAGVAGLALKRTIETTLRDSPLVIATTLIAVALVILVAERVGRRTRELESAGFRDALLVGCAQALALVPGVSRSGSTIAGGLFLGLSREAAARLSFLIGFPTILAACLLKAKDVAAEGGIAGTGWGAVAAGTLASAVSGYLVIRWMLRYVKERSFDVFVLYRILLGLGLLALVYLGAYGR